MLTSTTTTRAVRLDRYGSTDRLSVREQPGGRGKVVLTMSEG